MDINDLTKIVKENGIVGAGGAGFPTYAKFDKRADTIILNCAECEPLLRVHRQLLSRYAYELLSTLDTVASAVEADHVIVAVKSTYAKAIDAVRSNLDFFPNIQLKLLPEIYPVGDEVVLIYETTGKVVPPGSIPIETGITVFNVETVLNIYKALNHREPVYATYVTVTGEVRNPVTVKAPIGMSVEELVELAGGAAIEDPAYIMGGPMMGNIVNPYDCIAKTTNAILVLPKDHYVIRKKSTNVSIDLKRAMSACCQCESCTDLCSRHLLGHPITPHLFMRNASSGVTSDVKPFLDTMYCSSCGLCEMYSCPQGLSPRKLIAEYRNGLRRNGIKPSKDARQKEVDPMREYRRVPMERLIDRLGLHRYNVEAPLQDTMANAKQVKIKLNQHIGARALPIVHRKDIVKQGDLIAAAEEGKLSLPVHASIAGIVQEVNNSFVIIKSI